jgi:hypothetical protein
MLAFLIFALILLASMGLIQHIWNKKRDRQDALDAQSRFSPMSDVDTFANECAFRWHCAPAY